MTEENHERDWSSVRPGERVKLHNYHTGDYCEIKVEHYVHSPAGEVLFAEGIGYERRAGWEIVTRDLVAEAHEAWAQRLAGIDLDDQKTALEFFHRVAYPSEDAWCTPAGAEGDCTNLNMSGGKDAEDTRRFLLGLAIGEALDELFEFQTGRPPTDPADRLQAVKTALAAAKAAKERAWPTK